MLLVGETSTTLEYWFGQLSPELSAFLLSLLLLSSSYQQHHHPPSSLSPYSFINRNHFIIA
jgi:uncharacterized membrane protein